MTKIRRIVLDVLKPHEPSIIEVAKMVSGLEGVLGVNISLEEADAQTDSVKVTIEGNDIDFEKIKEVLAECDAVIHSIDGVSAGVKIVEEVSTPQDR